jgi:hypothetical protein
METFLLAVDSVYGLIFVGAAVLAALQSQRDLRLARGLVIVGVTLMATRWGVWALTTEANWLTRAAVGALIGATLFVLAPAALHWLSERIRASDEEGSVAKVHEDASSPSLPGLFIECGLARMPIKTTLPDEKIFVMQLFDGQFLGGLAEITTGGAEYSFGSNPAAAMMNTQRCQIINYGKETEVSIRLDLTAKIIETLDQGAGQRGTGKILDEKQLSILIRKIDPGPANPFVFYINNQSHNFVQIKFPSAATARRLTDRGERVVRVTLGDFIPLSLVPVFDAPPLPASPSTETVPLPPTKPH